MRKAIVGSVLGVVVAVAAVYLAALGYLWATQRSHVFRPGIGPLDLINSTVARYMREETIRTSDGLALMSWYAPAKPGHRTIVYFHGNAGTLGDRHERVLAYLERGYGVLLVGYRGYGGNPGEPTESGLYNDGRAHLDWLGHPVAGDKLYPDEQIFADYQDHGWEAVAERLPLGRQALHAAWIQFPHPRTGEPVEVESPLPAELLQLLKDR